MHHHHYRFAISLLLRLSDRPKLPLSRTSGFAIVYDIDNGDGRQYTQLKLDPRLLAKLMTESYPGTANVESGDPGIGTNPISLFRDPEFLALNPGFSLPGAPQTAPAATLSSILSQSDVIYTLTSYINADPEARAWLDGHPDPWGMVVNPAYKHLKLPVFIWPPPDSSTAGPDYQPSQNPCLATAKASSRIPDRPLIDNPQSTLGQVVYIQYSIAASEITCNAFAGTGKFRAVRVRS